MHKRAAMLWGVSRRAFTVRWPTKWLRIWDRTLSPSLSTFAGLHAAPEFGSDRHSRPGRSPLPGEMALRALGPTAPQLRGSQILLSLFVNSSSPPSDYKTPEWGGPYHILLWYFRDLTWHLLPSSCLMNDILLNKCMMRVTGCYGLAPDFGRLRRCP